jgi:hypothetical protein
MNESSEKKGHAQRACTAASTKAGIAAATAIP